MHVAKKRRRILLDLLHHEPGPSIQPSLLINDAGLEWTLQTPGAHPLISLAGPLRIRESDSRRSGLTLGSLVDVSCARNAPQYETSKERTKPPLDVDLLAVSAAESYWPLKP